MPRLNILVSKARRLRHRLKVGTEKSWILPTPLFLNRGLLRDMDITFGVFHDDVDALYDTDCVLIENRVFRDWGREAQDRKAYALLERLNRRVERVIWLDTTDGTGTTQFQLLPYVDAYFKTHILKDKTAYTRGYYGGRIFTDYYHNQYGADDSGEAYYPVPAKDSDLHKIQLGWNQFLQYLIYFGPWTILRQRLSRYFTSEPKLRSPNFVEPSGKSLDISARFGIAYSRETVAYHRHLVRQVMQSLHVPTEKLSRSKYLRELRESRVAVSPFGWGEPSYKDYEIIINGAALLKPDLSHMATWPNLYVAGETYLPFKWDCSDLEDVLEDALAGDKWRRIASQAQAVYRKHLFERQGREEFCERVQQMVLSSPPPDQSTA